MAVKIKRKSKSDLGDVFLPRIEKLWRLQDRSEVDKQRLVSTLRGILIPADKSRPTEFDRDIEFLLEVVKCR